MQINWLLVATGLALGVSGIFVFAGLLYVVFSLLEKVGLFPKDFRTIATKIIATPIIIYPIKEKKTNLKAVFSVQHMQGLNPPSYNYKH